MLQYVSDHRGSIIKEPCTVLVRVWTHTNKQEYAAITPTLSMSTDTIESFL